MEYIGYVLDNHIVKIDGELIPVINFNQNEYNNYKEYFSFKIDGVLVCKHKGRDHQARSDYSKSIKQLNDLFLICDFLANILGEKNG